MKLEKPINENYAATVVSIKSLVPLNNCDNVVGSPLFGFQAVISKSTQVGDLGIVFPAETQLSEGYVKNNNLFRHSELNSDATATGYLEDNRRVKAMKFRGHRSDCLFMPLKSLEYLGVDVSELNEGDSFDQLNGQEICRKYVVAAREAKPKVEKNKNKVFKRVDVKFLPEHYDSDNYFRNKDKIDSKTNIVVTQKLHGTSIRIGNTIVQRKLSVVERLLQKLGVKVQSYEFDQVSGSRKVIKDPNNPYQNHFYESDIWTLEGQKLVGVIPENFIIYGELIGWTPDGAPIQKNYTYQVPQKECELYVYRVAFVNNQGKIFDLAWDQLKEFCHDYGLKHVPELWRGKLTDFSDVYWLDKRFNDGLGLSHTVPLENDRKLVDEGVCIRVDNLAPYILKAKSPVFLQHETKMLDQEVLDMEEEGK